MQDYNPSVLSNVIKVLAGTGYTVALLGDGTVDAAGQNQDGQCDVYDWTDIVDIAVTPFGLDNDYYTVGLK
jgi:alpha-tubulin suppressor-like RCC1 family protein